MIPKPKLPRRIKKKARCLLLSDVATLIATSQGERRVFFWLAAETAIRSGELAGIKLTEIEGDRLTVSQTVWGGEDHAHTGVFTLGVYGGQPDWERNIEAAQTIAAEIAKAVLLTETKLKQESEPEVAASSGYSGSLTIVKRK
jgi:hypothetical protein